MTKPLTVEPGRVRVGASFVASGAGCKPRERVFLSMGTAAAAKRDLGTTVANGAGRFRATVRVPAEVPVGNTEVWAACRAPNPTGKEVSTATIVILR